MRIHPSSPLGSLEIRKRLIVLASQRAFSLLEILLSIALVSVLVVLLFSAISAASGQAKSSKCVANIRTVGSAAFVYAADHSGTLPQGFTGPYPNPPGTNWNEFLAPYAGLKVGSVIGINALTCPEKSSFDIPYSAYGANYVAVISLNPGQTGSAWMEPGAKRLNGSVDGRAFMFADAVSTFTYSPVIWPLSRDTDGDGVRDSNNMTYSGLDFRHNRKANFFLVNGSVVQLTSKQWAENTNNIWGEPR